jgi:hypothetical protein
MSGIYSVPNRQLKPSDIASIRQLYGARQDPYEPTSNHSRATATAIPTPAGYSGAGPLSVQGSLKTTSDVDFYRLTPLAGKEKVNVRLWASGISLVKAKIEIQDRFGKKIADAKVDSIFENNLQLEIGSLKDHPHLFIRVSSNTNDVFGVGDYRIDLDYRDPAPSQTLCHLSMMPTLRTMIKTQWITSRSMHSLAPQDWWIRSRAETTPWRRPSALKPALDF